MSETHYYGAVINPHERNPREPISYSVYPACLIIVSTEGQIVDMITQCDIVDFQEKEKERCNEAVTVILNSDEFLMPGFIDTHTHAPQFPTLGIGQEYRLLDWLKNVIYPMEANFADLDFAECTYRSVVRRIVSFGTTTCCYYGSVHLDATKCLVDIVSEIGQRAFIGKCNMDREVPEDNLEPSAQVAIQVTEELVNYIQDLTQTSDSPLIRPIITPRFAISCTPELLRGLGNLAAKYDPPLHIQTHIGENLDEVAKVGELFPGNTSYADVYDSFGLLGEKTILGHAAYLGDDEVDLIAKRKAGISHCPTSNFNLTSGVAPVGKYLDAGIKVGLGTDVSGGYSPSILNAIQHASIASKVIALQHDPSDPLKPGYNNRKLSVATLLYLATLGGAQVCGLEDDIGSFAIGKSFDALIVNVSSEAGNPGLYPDGEEVVDKHLRGMLERFLFCGDDRNISRVYVQGKLIGGNDFLE